MAGNPKNNFPRALQNPRIVVCIIMLITTAVTFRENYTGKSQEMWKPVIASDGRGYYAYLPSLFIYGETGFEQVLERESKVYPLVQAGIFMSEANGQPVNKYFLGVALLMLPFFLLATVFSLLSGMPADGYNSIYQLMISVAALFYLWAGLTFIRKLLKIHGFGNRVINLTLVVILFATNLLHYTVAAPSMSHVYSFFAIAGLIYFGTEYFRRPRPGIALSTVLMFSLTILIRPLNGVIIILLPGLAPSLRRFADVTKMFFRQPLSYLFILAGLSILMLQPVWWHFECGKALVWSYGGEGFYFTHPQIVKVLFSFRKGLFVYTPLCLVSLAGLIPFFRSNRAGALFTMLFLFIYIWLVSSWWNWYYGDSFGQRVFIDIFPVFALLLACFLQWVRHIRWLNITVTVLLVLLTAFNLFQSWQYSRGIIHPSAMDREKYAMVFLQTKEKYRHIFHDLRDTPPFGTDMNTPLRSDMNDFEKEKSKWITSGSRNFNNGSVIFYSYTHCMKKCASEFVFNRGF